MDEKCGIGMINACCQWVWLLGVVAWCGLVVALNDD